MWCKIVCSSCSFKILYECRYQSLFERLIWNTNWQKIFTFETWIKNFPIANWTWTKKRLRELRFWGVLKNTQNKEKLSFFHITGKYLIAKYKCQNFCRFIFEVKEKTYSICHLKWSCQMGAIMAVLIF